MVVIIQSLYIPNRPFNNQLAPLSINNKNSNGSVLDHKYCSTALEMYTKFTGKILTLLDTVGFLLIKST